MKGFDPQFADFPDYILKITAEIWEGRGLTTLNRYYAPDMPTRMASGIVMGNQAVIDGTLSSLNEFPDRQLMAQDVIWSGDDEQGFLSSHRSVTTGTHTGHGSYGPPTGRSFQVYVIADCAAKDNAIYDEWLVRDAGGIVRQLGFDPATFARDQIAAEGGVATAARPFSPENDVDGGYHGRGNDNEWGARFADILTQMMSKDFAVIRRDYDRAVHTEHAGGQGGWSWDFVERSWMRLRSSFPSATFTIHHVIGREDRMMPPRAAVRWSLDGRHDGYGAFGRPTGAKVHVMGISHAEFGPWGLRREVSLWDEVSIWKQIHLHTGAHD